MNNNPITASDPTGMYVDLIVEVVSISVGATSAVNNVMNGNWGDAAVDVGGAGCSRCDWAGHSSWASGCQTS